MVIACIFHAIFGHQHLLDLTIENIVLIIDCTWPFLKEAFEIDLENRLNFYRRLQAVDRRQVQDEQLEDLDDDTNDLTDIEREEFELIDSDEDLDLD